MSKSKIIKRSHGSSNDHKFQRLSNNKTKEIEKEIIIGIVESRERYLSTEIKKYQSIRVIYD